MNTKVQDRLKLDLSGLKRYKMNILNQIEISDFEYEIQQLTLPSKITPQFKNNNFQNQMKSTFKNVSEQNYQNNQALILESQTLIQQSFQNENDAFKDYLDDQLSFEDLSRITYLSRQHRMKYLITQESNHYEQAIQEQSLNLQQRQNDITDQDNQNKMNEELNNDQLQQINEDEEEYRNIKSTPQRKNYYKNIRLCNLDLSPISFQSERECSITIEEKNDIQFFQATPKRIHLNNNQNNHEDNNDNENENNINKNNQENEQLNNCGSLENITLIENNNNNDDESQQKLTQRTLFPLKYESNEIDQLPTHRKNYIQQNNIYSYHSHDIQIHLSIQDIYLFHQICKIVQNTFFHFKVSEQEYDQVNQEEDEAKQQENEEDMN